VKHLTDEFRSKLSALERTVSEDTATRARSQKAILARVAAAEDTVAKQVTTYAQFEKDWATTRRQVYDAIDVITHR